MRIISKYAGTNVSCENTGESYKENGVFQKVFLRFQILRQKLFSFQDRSFCKLLPNRLYTPITVYAQLLSNSTYRFLAY